MLLVLISTWFPLSFCEEEIQNTLEESFPAGETELSDAVFKTENLIPQLEQHKLICFLAEKAETFLAAACENG